VRSAACTSIGELLASAAERDPKHVVLRDVGAEGSAPRTFTAAALDALARRIAGVLRAHGVMPGRTVALLGDNSGELVAAWFGIAYAGCVVLPIAVSSTPSELGYRLAHARAAAVIADRARDPLVQAALAEPALAQQPALASLELEVLASDESAPLTALTEVSASDTAMLLYTSGTTAGAKGAAISHHSLRTHTLALAEHALRLTPSDRVLGVLPLAHSYGCRMVMLASLHARACVVLVPRFSAARTLALLNEEAITWVPVVPTMLAAWVAEPMTEKPRALAWVLSAGAPLADALALRAEEKLGALVRQGYGMTEATFSAINAPPDARVLGSVGKPSPGVTVRVVDEEGRDCKAGEDGEVIVAGPNVMTRYVHDEDASADALRDGFMHSGDIGRFDAEGHLFIVDRSKDLIIRGGHNVYPSEVEAALATHPAVHDVAVIGRPDAYYGEEVVAVIVLKPGSIATARALAEHAAERVGRTKIPREVAFTKELPLGASGKVQKRTLRGWLAEGKLVLERAV
jgi:long-chain acyl-CoA synthetase